MTETKTKLEVQYLEDIDKSRRIIDNLNLLPERVKNISKAFDEIIEYHQDMIMFYLDELDQYYKKYENKKS